MAELSLNERIAAHIDACASRMGHVVFIKKDRSVRRLTFQQSAMPSRVKGTGGDAVETRKANNPNLKTVWDMNATDKATGTRGAFRQVNLDTVATVKANGVTVRYRELAELRK